MAVVEENRTGPGGGGVPAALRAVGRSYLLRRVGRTFATVFLIASLTFWLVRLMPGNPVDVYVNELVRQGIPYSQAVQQASSLFSFNVDKPALTQYAEYLHGLGRGDLGVSITSPGEPVSAVILQYLPWTLLSVGAGLAISFVVGVLLGTFLAYRRNSWLDHALTNVFAFVQAVPNYIIAILLLVYLGVQTSIIDVTAMRGTLSPGVVPGFNATFVGDALYHAALPIAVNALTAVGGWMLAMKASTESVLREDYVTVAAARGLRDGRIMLAHVARNAILPLFTQLMISLGFAVGGSILTETIFAYQGLGYGLATAVAQRDYPVVQGIFLVITISVVLCNFLADLTYSRLDPRVRLSGRSSR